MKGSVDIEIVSTRLNEQWHVHCVRLSFGQSLICLLDYADLYRCYVRMVFSKMVSSLLCCFVQKGCSRAKYISGFLLCLELSYSAFVAVDGRSVFV